MSNTSDARDDGGMNKFESSLKPEQVLCHLLLTKLKVDVDPRELRDFIVDNWRKVQVCAHRIHDRDAAVRAAAEGEKNHV